MNSTAPVATVAGTPPGSCCTAVLIYGKSRRSDGVSGKKVKKAAAADIDVLYHFHSDESSTGGTSRDGRV